MILPSSNETLPMPLKPTMLNSSTAPTTKQAVVTIFVIRPFLKRSASTPPTKGSRKARNTRKLKFKTVISCPRKLSLYPKAICAPVQPSEELSPALKVMAGRNIMQNATMPSTNAIAPGIKYFRFR